ncbi:MAG: hypothetical protein J3K34DRAFT_407047 [Monoraphidium minutum]|nr:MAG: hypothetical protein J3K34DRAFT_407047 [Monoraphidium minutum]
MLLGAPRSRHQVARDYQRMCKYWSRKRTRGPHPVKARARGAASRRLCFRKHLMHCCGRPRKRLRRAALVQLTACRAHAAALARPPLACRPRTAAPPRAQPGARRDAPLRTAGAARTARAAARTARRRRQGHLIRSAASPARAAAGRPSRPRGQCKASTAASWPACRSQTSCPWCTPPCRGCARIRSACRGWRRGSSSSSSASSPRGSKTRRRRRCRGS